MSTASPPAPPPGIPASSDPPTEVSFPVVGMTCASCSNRIERFLRKTDGVVEASVNLATEVATIRYLPERVDRADLVGAIEKAGYEVRPGALQAADARAAQRAAARPAPRGRRPLPARRDRDGRDRACPRRRDARARDPVGGLDRRRRRDHGPDVLAGAPARHEDVNRLVLWPATFVQFWAGRRFYAPAWRALRHGFGTNMNTLVAVGTSAAWGYSVFVTMWPEIVMRAGLRARPTSTRRRSSSA